MTNFNTNYLKLLREQVEEEIDYLNRNGHANEKIHVRCMFCIDTQKGYFRCHRLQELQRFHSSVLLHQHDQLLEQKGYETSDQKNKRLEKFLTHQTDSIDHAALPLLSVKL